SWDTSISWQTTMKNWPIGSSNVWQNCRKRLHSGAQLRRKIRRARMNLGGFRASQAFPEQDTLIKCQKSSLSRLIITASASIDKAVGGVIRLLSIRQYSWCTDYAFH